MKQVCFRRPEFIRKHSPQKLALACAVASASAGTSLPALSQNALEEVVVTARKKEESLQESPLAITAFSGQKLKESGITNLADFNTSVPNVDVGEGNGNAGVANIFIRGVGQRNTEANLDSGVATYIDGVYIGRADGALLDVNDLASVEVLRGPQGTLFGKNSTGGALVFTTNRPQPEFAANLTIRGGNYETRDAQGFVNIPLIEDTLYTRISAVSKKRDGYLYNVVDGKNYNDVDRLSTIWQARWLAGEDVTVDFNANYGLTAQSARLQKCGIVEEAIDSAWQLQATAGSVNAAYNKSLIDICEETRKLGTYEAASDLGGSYEAENQGFSTTIDWSINDTMSLKSITAWRGTKASQDDDVDSLPIPLLHRSNSAHPFAEERATDQYSQELQLTGEAFNRKVEWVAGIYAFREMTRGGITTNQVGPIQFLPPEPFKYFYTTFATELDADNKAYSVFSQFDWTLSENWVFTGGLRYTDEKRKLGKNLYAVDESTLGLDGATVDNFLQQAILVMSKPNSLNYLHDYMPDPESPPINEEVSKDAWTPMASIRYLLPETNFINEGSVFLTYSEGFRSGGLSEAAGDQLEVFEPEEVNNIELGIKIDTWDNRLRLNASLFHMEYTNRQLTTVVFDYEKGIPSGATINAKDSTISGLELETTIFPLEGLEIQFNGTWNKGKIKEFEDVQILARDPLDTPTANCVFETAVIQPIKICNIDRSDENLPRLAEETYMLAIQYTLPTPYGIIIPRIQGSWKFDVDNCFDRSSCTSGLWYSDKQADISARLTWLSPQQQWRVTAFGSNLSKEEYVNGATALVDALGYGGLTYNTPRMVGIEAEYTF